MFSGTKSFSKVAAARGFDTYTIDNDPELSPDLCGNMADVTTLFAADVLWSSPPCQAFSVAAIGKNWNRDYSPKHDRAAEAMQLVIHTLKLIEDAQPTWWFIENPRGMLRKMPFMEVGIRHTVTYCQYGDTRMKPTDIWTNAIWWRPRMKCGNGDPCHESAPRGAKTGTQGIKGARDRGIIPPALFEEIFNQMPQ